jgi:protein-serine/threonine kinase
MIRQDNQARAVNEVVNALKTSTTSRPEVAQLRVVNGISTPTSSTITTAARENVPLTPVDGFPGQPGNSTIRWGGGLPPHLEHDLENDPNVGEREMPEVALPPPPRPINPSLATLEKAVSARIYFENLYFPLLRHPASREQRRLAMEREMAELQLSEHQKENLRARWRRNETDYLRHQRRKVDVTAFVKLKTIGHGLWLETLHPAPLR